MSTVLILAVGEGILHIINIIWHIHLTIPHKIRFHQRILQRSINNLFENPKFVRDPHLGFLLLVDSVVVFHCLFNLRLSFFLHLLFKYIRKKTFIFWSRIATPWNFWTWRIFALRVMMNMLFFFLIWFTRLLIFLENLIVRQTPLRIFSQHNNLLWIIVIGSRQYF